MTFHSSLWTSSIQASQRVFDLIKKDQIDALRQVPHDEMLSAFTRGLSYNRHLGLVGLALDSEAPLCLDFLLHHPDWVASVAATPKDLDSLSDRLAQAIRPDSTWCLPAVLRVCPVAPLLTLHHMLKAHKEPLTHDKASGEPQFSLTTLLDRHGAYDGPYRHNSNVKTISFFLKQFTPTSLSDPPPKNPALSGAIVQALASAMTYDSGSLGPGEADIPIQAMECAQHVVEQGFGSPALLELLLIWAVHGRSQSRKAFTLLEHLSQKNNLPIPATLASEYVLKPRATHLPAHISTAWLAAFNARNADHVFIAQNLAQTHRPCLSTSPCISLDQPSKINPLRPLYTLWGHTLKAGKALPEAALRSAYSKYNQERACFGEAWSELTTQWDLHARTAHPLLKKGTITQDFPGGVPQNIQDIIQKSRITLSPLGARIEALNTSHPMDTLPLIETQTLMHCARATHLCGFSIKATLAQLHTSHLKNLTPVVFHHLEQIKLDLLVPPKNLPSSAHKPRL